MWVSLRYRRHIDCSGPNHGFHPHHYPAWARSGAPARDDAQARREQLISIRRRLDAIAADLQPHTPSRESVDGQVDELVIDETAAIDDELRTELVRQAALIDASVELVREHEGLLRHEGVGATLRFRIDGDGAEQDR